MSPRAGSEAAAIAAAKAGDEAALLAACHRIEAHFGFPAPNELVKNAEIPGGMYSNMVAQLKQLKAEEILPRAMELIPTVPPNSKETGPRTYSSMKSAVSEQIFSG